MYLSIVMEILQTLKDFLKNCGDDRLIENPILTVTGPHPLLDNVQQRT